MLEQAGGGAAPGLLFFSSKSPSLEVTSNFFRIRSLLAFLAGGEWHGVPPGGGGGAGGGLPPLPPPLPPPPHLRGDHLLRQAAPGALPRSTEPGRARGLVLVLVLVMLIVMVLVLVLVLRLELLVLVLLVTQVAVAGAGVNVDAGGNPCAGAGEHGGRVPGRREGRHHHLLRQGRSAIASQCGAVILTLLDQKEVI